MTTDDLAVPITDFRFSIFDCRLKIRVANRRSSIVNRKLTQCRSGQALLELAIFGGIVLAGLGFLIRIGMKMNFDQEIRMAAFRRALAAAYADNCTKDDAMGTAYYYRVDRQMPNPTDGFLAMPRSKSEAGAFVEWGDRLTFASKDRNPKTQPRLVVRLNDNETDEATLSYDDLPKDTQAPDGELIAFKGFIREEDTWNGVGVAWVTPTGDDDVFRPTITQTQAGSSVQFPAKGIVTQSSVILNTIESKPLSSRIESKAVSVNWSKPAPPPPAPQGSN